MACDVPSVNYQYSWRLQPWKHYYAGGSEIWQYLKETERENRFIDKYVKLRHEVIRAEWDEDKGVWRIRVRNLDTGETKDDAAEIFINAGGALNHWKWPEIRGLNDFKGRLVHSAAYDESIDLTGRRVAVIGAGSSGVQLVPAVQKQAEKLYTWIRSPIWITAGMQLFLHAPWTRQVAAPSWGSSQQHKHSNGSDTLFVNVNLVKIHEVYHLCIRRFSKSDFVFNYLKGASLRTAASVIHAPAVRESWFMSS